MNQVREIIQNKPKIGYGYSEKLTITILGLLRNYYVIGSRDEKSEATIVIFESSLPRKELQIKSLGAFQKSPSSRNSPYLRYLVTSLRF